MKTIFLDYALTWISILSSCFTWPNRYWPLSYLAVCHYCLWLIMLVYQQSQLDFFLGWFVPPNCNFLQITFYLAKPQVLLPPDYLLSCQHLFYIIKTTLFHFKQILSLHQENDYVRHRLLVTTLSKPVLFRLCIILENILSNSLPLSSNIPVPWPMSSHSLPDKLSHAELLIAETTLINYTIQKNSHFSYWRKTARAQSE